MKTIGFIESSKDLDDFISSFQPTLNSDCILRVYDNKSDVLLQSIVVKHPVIFIRGIQEFCKSVNLPVSDTSIFLVGFISPDSYLKEVPDIMEISPYVYFKKAEEVDTSSTEN